eukprot:3817196-Lingulodinium_polyedra.AAC.1
MPCPTHQGCLGPPPPDPHHIHSDVRSGLLPPRPAPDAQENPGGLLRVAPRPGHGPGVPSAHFVN